MCVFESQESRAVNKSALRFMPQCGHIVSDRRLKNIRSLVTRHRVKPQDAPLNVQVNVVIHVAKAKSHTVHVRVPVRVCVSVYVR